MTEQYTPTTEDVLHEVLWSKTDEAKPKHRRAFYRWLAKRYAEVAAKAYERAILDVGLNPDLANQLLDTNPYRKVVQS